MGLIVCDLETSKMKGLGQSWAVATQKNIYIYIYIYIYNT